MGVLVDDLSLAGGRLVGDVVDTVALVGLAIGVDHGRVVSLTGKTLYLQVSLLVAVPADDVGVPGTTGTGLAIVVGWAIVLFRREAVVVGQDGGDFLDLLLSPIFPDNLLGFIWQKFSFDGVDLVQPLVVILDGF